jgi:hypothetical protein
MEQNKWVLVSPAGIVPVVSDAINAHPGSLDGKTVFLRWNGKHNGDVFLSRIADHLRDSCQADVVKLWEVMPQTSHTSQNAEASRQLAGQVVDRKPDIVIAGPGD